MKQHGIDGQGRKTGTDVAESQVESNENGTIGGRVEAESGRNGAGTVEGTIGNGTDDEKTDFKMCFVLINYFSSFYGIKNDFPPMGVEPATFSIGEQAHYQLGHGQKARQ